jgi:hypothetical protein
MSDDFKSAAILELLTDCYYENVLIVNGWKKLNSVISLHGNNIFEVDDERSISDCIETEIQLDLIVAFLPSQETLDFIISCKASENVEAILVTSSQWTYNRAAVKKLQKLIFSNRSFKNSQVKNSIINNSCKNFDTRRYYGFPNITEPELILTRSSFTQYRRYWSWIKGVQDRSFFSLLAEYLFVSILKSCVLSPFTIFKID